MFDTPAEYSAHTALKRSLGALRREQISENDFDPLLPCKLNLILRHQPEIMNDITRLVFVPPAKRFGIYADCLEARDSFLNLNSLTTVRERERERAVDQNFHAPIVLFVLLVGNAISCGSRLPRSPK